jgi:uncharacterized protein (TIGR00369 family)
MGDCEADDAGDARQGGEVDWSSRVAGGETDGDGADLEALEAALREHGLFAWLDLDVEVVEPGRVVLGLPFDEKFANLTSGTVHGGVTATVIDTASGFALRSTFEDPAAARLTTTDLNVRYVRPARDDLRVEAEVVRAGGSMGVTESTVTTHHEGEEKVVATGGTSYRLFRD